MTAPTKAAALSLYRRAVETHKRADWRLAAHALAEVLGAERPAARTVSPVSLVPFLAKAGLKDEGGELTARDAEIWHKGKPFQRKLVRPDGVDMETAAQRAHDAGYFPNVPHPSTDSADNMHPVDPAMLMAAIDRELAGQPVYALGDQDDSYWEALEPEERVFA